MDSSRNIWIDLYLHSMASSARLDLSSGRYWTPSDIGAVDCARMVLAGAWLWSCALLLKVSATTRMLRTYFARGHHPGIIYWLQFHRAAVMEKEIDLTPSLSYQFATREPQQQAVLRQLSSLLQTDMLFDLVIEISRFQRLGQWNQSVNGLCRSTFAPLTP